MSRIRQFFKTSESDRDDVSPDRSEERKLKDVKNRKWLASSKSKLPIKDERKGKHLKENELATKNRAPANQSNFYTVINSEDVDCEANIGQQTHSDKSTPNDKCLTTRLDKICLKTDCLDSRNLTADSRSKPHYQNECVLCRNAQTVHNQVDYNQNNQPNEQQSISRQPATTTATNTTTQQVQIKHQQVKNKKNHSFTPKPLKIIRKKMMFRSPKDHSNDELSDDQRKTSLNDSQLTGRLANQTLNVNDAYRNDETSLNGSPTANSQRRRRQNQSFDNLSDRLEFIQSLSGHKIQKTYENEELKSSYYRSEDNLLSKIPQPPRSVIRLNREQKSLLKEQDTNQTRLSDQLQAGKLYCENPIYKSPDDLKRIRESVFNHIKQTPDYVNTPVFKESDSRPRKSDLVLLRQVKPRKFLRPENKLTTDEYKTFNLTYVNLDFDGGEREHEDDELGNGMSKSMNGDLRSGDSTSSASSDNSTDSANTGVNHTGVNHFANNKAKCDSIKSTDLAMLRSTKPDHLKSKQQSKSDDESNCRTEYCKIDWVKTDGLRELIRDARIKNHHHFL